MKKPNSQPAVPPPKFSKEEADLKVKQAQESALEKERAKREEFIRQEMSMQKDTSKTAQIANDRNMRAKLLDSMKVFATLKLCCFNSWIETRSINR